MIIHISGPSGSGKTYLGNKLKNKFGNKIVVKDMDNLRDEFINKNYDTSKSWSFDEKKYQKYIDNYISKQNKPLILVGLNNNNFGKTKTLYYNLHSKYNYYIDIDDMTVVKQKCLRFINDELKDLANNKEVINDMINNNERFIKLMVRKFKEECAKKQTFKDNKKWKRDYKNQGYKIMNKKDIYNEIIKIIKIY